MIAAANAALRVDVEAVRAELSHLLDRLAGGAAVDDRCEDVACRVRTLQRPWPQA